MSKRFKAPVFCADGTIIPVTVRDRYIVKIGHELDATGLAHTVLIVRDRLEQADVATYRGDLGGANMQAMHDVNAHVDRLNAEGL